MPKPGTRCVQAKPKALDPSWTQPGPWAQRGSKLSPRRAQGCRPNLGPSWVRPNVGPRLAQAGPSPNFWTFGNLQFGYLEIWDPKIYCKLYQSATLPIDSMKVSRLFSVCAVCHQEIIFFVVVDFKASCLQIQIIRLPIYSILLANAKHV